MSDELRLCYVSPPWCYFTTDFERQWGDDWDDAPYDCNAGAPYARDGARIMKVAIDSDLEAPTSFRRPWYSVAQINDRAVPWLAQPLGMDPVQVWAGTTLPDFIAAVTKAGGEVYMAREDRVTAEDALGRMRSLAEMYGSDLDLEAVAILEEEHR